MKKCVVYPLILLLGGCASLAATGEKYTELGHYQVAAYYYGYHYLQNRDDEEAQKALERSLDVAFRNLDADIAKAEEKKNFERALGLAIHKEHLIRESQRWNVGSWGTTGAAKSVSKLRKKAGDAALLQVDEAEAAGKRGIKKLELLRRALSLDPDNGELDKRYEQERQGLQENIVVGLNCTGVGHDYCQRFSAELVEKINAADRELIRLVPGSSEVKNARLIVDLRIQKHDSQWQPLQSGIASRPIPRQNKYKETLKNALGGVQNQIVSARYRLLRRTTKASVSAALRIVDLSGKADLYSGKTVENESREATYYEFEGDERAVNNDPVTSAYGTDQSPPPTPTQLLAIVTERAVNKLSKEILMALEKTTR